MCRRREDSVTRPAPVEGVGRAATGTDVAPAVAANIGLRGVMESGIVAAFAYWGYENGDGAARRTLAAIAACRRSRSVCGARSTSVSSDALPNRRAHRGAGHLWPRRDRIVGCSAARVRSHPRCGVPRTPRTGLRDPGTPGEGVTRAVSVTVHADARRSMRTPVIVGGVFGFVYVMANATLLPSEAAQALRVIAIVAFVGLLAMMRGSGRFDASRATGRFGRGYWYVVTGRSSHFLPVPSCSRGRSTETASSPGSR